MSRVALDELDVVFLDAAGTLFKVRGSVGEIYSSIASRYGVHTDALETELAFRRAFHTRSLAPLPPGDPATLAVKERRWWYEVVADVFRGRMSNAALQDYFEDVFEIFRRAEAWELYPDTMPGLQLMTSRGCRLGIISNFDSRLHSVLENLGIAGFFEQVTISWQVGAAKPHPRIFRSALEGMRASPDRALHVGDSIAEDYQGARAAGLHAVLLDRDRTAFDGERVRDLLELLSIEVLREN